MKLKTFLLATASLTAAISLICRSRRAKWQRETAAMVEQIEREAMDSGEEVRFADFDGLPAPVAAYFRFALQDGQKRIRTATIRHEGQFTLGDKWTPFVSTQHFSAHPVAFVWDAKMKMNRLLNVRVRDSFLGGRSAMKVKLLALFPIMDGHDDIQLDAGSLMRYLAELVWLPTALLPLHNLRSHNLRWTPIDDRRALATLTNGSTTVSLEFTFNQSGEISSFFAPARIYSTKDQTKEFPWSGRLWNYQPRNGLMIPIEGEVSWQMPQGNVPYYRGKIVDAQYD